MGCQRRPCAPEKVPCHRPGLGPGASTEATVLQGSAGLGFCSVYTHAIPHTQTDTQSHRDTHTNSHPHSHPYTFIHRHSCVLTHSSLHPCSHTLRTLLQPSYTLPSPSYTHLHSHFLLHSHFGVQAPRPTSVLLTCPPAGFGTGC